MNAALEQRGINVFTGADGQEANDRFVLLDSENLRKAQRAVDLLDMLAVILPVVTVALFVIAVLLSPRRRRTILRAALGIAFAMALVLIALNVGRSFYLDALGPDVNREAAASVYDQLLEFLRNSLRVGFALGAVVAIGAWLLGPGQIAGRIRNATVGLFGRQRTPETPPSPVAEFALRYRSGLRVAAVAVGVTILVVLAHPGPIAVLTIAVIVLICLALIEGLSRRARPALAPLRVTMVFRRAAAGFHFGSFLFSSPNTRTVLVLVASADRPPSSAYPLGSSRPSSVSR